MDIYIFKWNQQFVRDNSAQEKKDTETVSFYNSMYSVLF